MAPRPVGVRRHQRSVSRVMEHASKQADDPQAPPREPQLDPRRKGKAGAQLRKDRGLPPSRIGQSEAPPPPAASERRRCYRPYALLSSTGAALDNGLMTEQKSVTETIKEYREQATRTLGPKGSRANLQRRCARIVSADDWRRPLAVCQPRRPFDDDQGGNTLGVRRRKWQP